MSVEQRALELLGRNLTQDVVASACGVTAGRISQLMADDDFRHKVQELRYQNITKISKIDEKYDTLENKVLDQLEKTIHAIYKPHELLKAAQVLNAAKRRGSIIAGAEDVSNAKSITLNMPMMIVNRFIKDVNNQIIEVQDDKGNRQPLVTASSSSLANLTKSIVEQRANDKAAGEKRLGQSNGYKEAIATKLKITTDDL